MRTKLVSAVVTGALALGASAATAGAAGPPASSSAKVPAGIACQQAGISTLQQLGLLPAVAKDGIAVVGVGTVPFRTVLELHRTAPELFQTGGVTVVVPGVGEVAATWCNPS
jgi:hypothetical protein